MKFVFKIVFIILLCSSCSIKKSSVIGKYRCYLPYGIIELLPDSTYRADFKVEFYSSNSSGRWLKNKDTLILNSQYDSCYFYRVEVNNSIVDTSKFCVLTINYISSMDTSFVSGGYLLSVPTCAIFYTENDTIGDTLCVSEIGTFTFPKRDDYTRVKAFLPSYKGRCIIVSAEQNIHLSDTISLFYDLGYDEQYRIYNDEKFIFNRKNKMIASANYDWKFMNSLWEHNPNTKGTRWLRRTFHKKNSK